MSNASAILGAMMEIAGEDDASGEELLGELLGEIEGEDDSAAILGAEARAGSSAAKAAIRKAITARRLGSAQILSKKGPSSSGVQAIGFFQAGIAAGAPATITTQPQTWFKPMRLVVGESIAPFFTIDNIIVGNKSQFPSPIPLPAEMFVPSAEAVVMDLSTVNPALNLTIIVTNVSGVPQNFRAGFVGKEVTP